MYQFVNLMSQDITIVDNSGKIVAVIKTSGNIARVETKTVKTGEINGIPVTMTEFGKLMGLPEPKDDTILIVSTLVAQACKDREDVFIPNEPLRDEQGNCIGYKSLGRIE